MSRKTMGATGSTADSILAAAEPEEVFGSLAVAAGEPVDKTLCSKFRSLARSYHPDRASGTADRKKRGAVMAALNVLRDRAEAKLKAGIYGKGPTSSLKAKHLYSDLRPLRGGDISDLYAASYQNPKGEIKPVIIKVARSPRDRDLMENEAKVLVDLHGKRGKDDARYQKYLPRLIESTSVKVGSLVRPTNVLSLTRESYTMEEVRAAFPDGIHAADMAWMWRRNLEILSWVHVQDYVHGAVLPSHVLVCPTPTMHAGRLIGWSYAVHTGDKIKAISTQYRDFYPPEVLAKETVTPATDIYMSAKCALHLLALDRLDNRKKTPRRIVGLLQACTLSRPSARYQTVSEVYAEFDAILREEYGPPAFRPFAMPVPPSVGI